MSLTGSLVLIGAIVVVVALFFLALWRQYRNVGPNEVLIISGGRRRTVVEPDGTKRTIGYRMSVGGGAFVLPFIETTNILSLEVLTLTLKTQEVLTVKGVPIIAEAVAQVKVEGDDFSIRQAAEQFLSTGLEGIREVSHQILEGYVRTVIGTMTVEEIYQNREDFSKQVVEMASKDFKQMGLVIISFTLKDVSDTQGYLEALGKPRVAEVKRDAQVAEAETDKDATIKSALARKEGEIVKLQAETEIAEASRDYEARRAEYQAIINQKRAQADLAYDLEKHRMNQQVKREESQVRLVEKEQAIKVEEQEILRREKELESTVKKPADARKYEIQTIAEADSYRLGLEAKGKAAAKRLDLEVEAERIRAEGSAEAEAMAKKAESWGQYNQAAVYQMFVNILPELARAVAEPLSRVDKIVMVGGGGDGSLGASRITGQVAEVLAQLPTVVEALSGVDLTKLLERLPQARTAGESEEKPSAPEANESRHTEGS